MHRGLTNLLKALRLYHPLRDLRRSWRFQRKNAAATSRWEATGRPMPAPDALKYRVIRAYARRYATPVMIETGTFYGDAIFALRREFREIHSVELARGLFDFNAEELAHHRHIHLHFGDSAVVLPRLVSQVTAPTLFWLDGHFCSGPSARADIDTPISAELDCILSRPPGCDVVLIDDARLFVGQDGYPSIEQLRTAVRARRPRASFEVDLDIIRIAPV